MEERSQKEFEGDAQKMLEELHMHHTQSEMAQKLTTQITNLRLNAIWKGTTQQFLAHLLQAELRLLDSLSAVHEKLPESTRITFL